MFHFRVVLSSLCGLDSSEEVFVFKSHSETLMDLTGADSYTDICSELPVEER